MYACVRDNKYRVHVSVVMLYCIFMRNVFDS